MSFTFKHGVHPPENKQWTEGAAIEEMPLGKTYAIPLSQHIGVPSQALVKKKEEVKKGQKIGEVQAFVSSPVHAPTSGKVKDVVNHPHPLGKSLPAVIIEVDGEDEWDESIKGIDDPFSQDINKLVDMISAAGVVGMGGATFPTHVKLSPPKEKAIDTVIINGAECEPFLTADHRLMLEQPDKVIQGLKIIMYILGVKSGYIGIENNKPDAISLFNEKLAGQKEIQVAELQVKYPQGAEKQLINALLDRQVPSGGLPMDVGALVHNVGTTTAIYDAIYHGYPLIERITTVTGSAVSRPANLKVRIGTSFQEAIDFCGGLKDDAGKIISGGPMMGMAQLNDQVPITKGTSGILVQAQVDLRSFEYLQCIRCGQCVQACPLMLVPNEIGIYAELSRFEDCERVNTLDCMECGSCSFVCPSNRPLVHFIKRAKGEIMASRKKEG